MQDMLKMYRSGTKEFRPGQRAANDAQPTLPPRHSRTHFEDAKIAPGDADPLSPVLQRFTLKRQALDIARAKATSPGLPWRRKRHL